MAYELYYWPGIQGRGEFVRLALEEAGADYIDIARNPAGEDAAVGALMAVLEDEGVKHPPFAPPFLKDGDILIGQTAAILLYLGDRHGLAPREAARRLWVHQFNSPFLILSGRRMIPIILWVPIYTTRSKSRKLCVAQSIFVRREFPSSCAGSSAF